MTQQKLSIGWGKPNIFYRKVSDSFWKKVPDVVEDSYQLTPTKGDKKTANVEGGEAEAVKHKANSYEAAYALRLAAEREMHIDHTNGLVDDEYALCVIPEDANVPGPYIERSEVSVEDPMNAGDGSNWTYTHSCLKPVSGGKMVKWGKFTATEGTGADAGKYTIAAAQGYDFAAATQLQPSGSGSGSGSGSA